MNWFISPVHLTQLGYLICIYGRHSFYFFLYTTHHVSFLLTHLQRIISHLIIYITYESLLFSLLIQNKKNKARDNGITMINKIITAINQNGILLLLFVELRFFRFCNKCSEYCFFARCFLCLVFGLQPFGKL